MLGRLWGLEHLRRLVQGPDAVGFHALQAAPAMPTSKSLRAGTLVSTEERSSTVVALYIPPQTPSSPTSTSSSRHRKASRASRGGLPRVPFGGAAKSPEPFGNPAWNGRSRVRHVGENCFWVRLGVCSKRSLVAVARADSTIQACSPTRARALNMIFCGRAHMSSGVQSIHQIPPHTFCFLSPPTAVVMSTIMAALNVSSIEKACRMKSRYFPHFHIHWSSCLPVRVLGWDAHIRHHATSRW